VSRHCDVGLASVTHLALRSITTWGGGGTAGQRGTNGMRAGGGGTGGGVGTRFAVGRRKAERREPRSRGRSRGGDRERSRDGGVTGRRLPRAVALPRAGDGLGEAGGPSTSGDGSRLSSPSTTPGADRSWHLSSCLFESSSSATARSRRIIAYF